MPLTFNLLIKFSNILKNCPLVPGNTQSYKKKNVCNKGAVMFLDNNSCDHLQDDKFNDILYHVLFLLMSMT